MKNLNALFKNMLLIVPLAILSTTVTAQVGIGNTDPKATLDITASNVTTPTSTDGILIPRLDNFPSANPMADQDGMMIFITGNGTPSKGFYYWDNTQTAWVGITGVKKINDLIDGKSDNDGTEDGSSIFLGIDAGLNDDGTNNTNIGIGFQALYNNTTGYNNTSVGHQALYNNTTARGNTAIGSSSLKDNSTGLQNTAVGSFALWSNTTGNYNVGLGRTALLYNIDGVSNTAIGTEAMYNNRSGNNNIAVGHNALRVNNTGSQNIAVGVSALELTRGDGNTAVGYAALSENTTGINNVAIGPSAGGNVNNGSNNIFLGYQAGLLETGSNKLYIENSSSNRPLIYGEFNNDLLRINGTLDINNAYQFPTTDGTANQVFQTDGAGAVTWTDASTLVTHSINDLTDGKSDSDGSQDGSSIFLGIDAGANDDSTDNKNIGIGFQALASNTSGGNNSGIGYQVLANNTTGGGNVALGTYALTNNTTGIQNTGIGTLSLRYNVDGNYNTSVGRGAMENNSNGDNNTAVGTNAMSENTSGTGNVAMGYNALGFLLTGNNNIGIGQNAQVPNQNANNQVRIGNNAITYAGIQVAWTVTSDSIWKKEVRNLPYGLDMVNKLRPVDYIRKNDDNQTREMGFIAQDLEKVVDEMGYTDQGFLTKDDKGRYSVRYNDFIALLTKAVKEQQTEIESQKEEIALLKAQVAGLKNLEQRINKLENTKEADLMVAKN